MKTFVYSILITLLVFSFSKLDAQDFKTDDILGKWITEEGESVVQIFKKENKYYGKLIWLKEPNDENGKVKTDNKNPNEKLQKRKIKGLIFMYSFEFDDGEWENGKVYDPKKGKTYSGTLKLRTKDIMDLRGYIGISLIGRTSTWVRYKKKKEN